jgi:hypothetical protein
VPSPSGASGIAGAAGFTANDGLAGTASFPDSNSP